MASEDYTPSKARELRERSERLQKEFLGATDSACSLPSHFRGPFKYHASVGVITDGNGTRVLDVRAWGYLTGLGDGGCKIPYGPAMIIKDRLGEWIAAALTEAANNPTETRRACHER